MFTFTGHRQTFLLILALICLGLPGCGKKKDSSQSKTGGKTLTTSPETTPKRDILKEPQAEDVSELVALLSSKDESTRQTAAVALGLLKSDASSSVTDLAKLLEDESSEVRTSATHALAAIGGDAAVSSLSQAAISEEDKAARTEMWIALGLLGAASALNSSEMTSEDRSAAIAGLKKNGDNESVSVAIDQWLSSDNAETRQAGLAQLSQNPATKEHVAKAIELLRDEDAAVRKQAVETLKSVKLDSDMQASSLVNRFVTAADDEERQLVQQELNKSGPDTSSALLKLITEADAPADVRTSALGLLSGQDSEVLAKNVDQLQALKLPKDTDAATSNMLASTLLKAGGKPSQQALLQLAVSPQIDSEVRSQVLSLLEPSDGPDVASELAAALKQVGTTESSEESQLALTLSFLSAIKAQGPNGASAAADIASVGSDANSDLNRAVLDTLLAVNPSAPETTSALKAALAADDKALKDHSLAALKNADASQLQQLTPQLAQQLNDASTEEKQVVLGLLQKAGPKALATAAPAIADSLANAKTSEERKTFLGLMAQMEPSEFDASKSLAAALEDEDPEVVESAIKLLSNATPQQLAKVAPELASAIESGTAEQNKQLLDLLKQGGPDAINAAAPAIAKELKESPQAIDKGQVLKILADANDAADAFAETLADMAGSDDPETQKEALALLQNLSPESLKSVAPKLSKQLANSNGDQMTPLLSLLNKAGGDSMDAAATALSKKLKQSTEPADKKRMLELLSKMDLPAEKQLETAKAAMSDEDEDVRAKALAMLTKPGATSPEVIQQLISSAEDDSATVRKLAMKGLVAAGKNAADAKPLLNKILEGESDPESRRQALTALSKMASGDESKALLNRALADSELQSESAKLVTRNPVDGVATVADAMQSENAETAKFASDLLEKMSSNKAGRKGLTALAKNSDQHRGLALMSLGAVPKGVSKTAAANALLPFIRKGEQSKDAWKLMSGLGNEALPTLGEIVTDDQIAPEAKKRALKMIAGSDDPEIAGPILESLISDDEGELGTEAALAMAMIDPSSESAASRIASELSKPDSSFDNQQLMKQLKAMKTDPSDAMRSLLNAPGSPDAIRKEALKHLLAESPVSEETAAALLKATSSENSDVSLAAALKLADSDSPAPEVTQRLIAELSNEEAVASPEVLKALSTMGPAAASSATALAALAKRDPANVDVLKTIASLGENAGPALDAVRTALESEDPAIRELALDTLIASKDSSPATMESLQQIEDPELTAKASELVTAIRKTIAESRPAVSEIAGYVQPTGDCGGAVVNAGCAPDNCVTCGDRICKCPTPCVPTPCCQPEACQPASCHVFACQPVCVTPKKSKTRCPKVKVKTVSYRKYQKMQARTAKRNRR